MEVLLYVSALLIAAVGIAHSYLGERYILIRLFRRDDLPKLFGSSEYTARTLRFAWHITSVAWLGLAAVLLLLAHPPVTPANIGMAVGCTFLVHSAVAFGGSRGRHYSWIAFLAIGALTIYATRAQPSVSVDAVKLQEFATRYTAAWCSQDAARVAAFFAEGGSLKINDGTPSVGRTAITEAAQGFMTAFPDMVVTMDGVSIEGSQAIYRWTLAGTNAGPGGTGKTVRISGYEEWTIGADGLIVESKGHFDEAEYNRQLKAGFDGD